MHVDVIGTKAFGDAEPMPRDAIFRIASLTKPIAAAAAMILVDDGVLALDARSTRISPSSPIGACCAVSTRRSTTPCRPTRAITLDDLLTFRLGFGAVMVPPDTYPIQAAERELRLVHARPAVAADAAHPGRVDPAFRFASADASARRAVAVQHRVTGARRPARARRRQATRGLPARTDLRTARHERHRVQRVARISATGSPPRTPPTPSRTCSTCSTVSRTATGARRPRSRTPPAGWCRRSTTSGRSSRCCSPTARSTANGSSRERSVELMTTDHLTPSNARRRPLFLGDHDGWGFGMAVPARTSRTSWRPATASPAGSGGRAAPARRGGPIGHVVSRASCSPSGR